MGTGVLNATLRFRPRLPYPKTPCVGPPTTPTLLLLDVLFSGGLCVKVVIGTRGSGSTRSGGATSTAWSRPSLDPLVWGRWVGVLDELLTGPASEHVEEGAQAAQRQLTQTLREGDVGKDILTLSEAAASFVAQNQPGFKRAQLRQWFTTFAWIRNKTRGHGAQDFEDCSNIAIPLGDSLSLMMDALLVSKWPWAVIRRGISGRYRVTPLGNGTSPSLQELKTRPDSL